MHRTVVTELRRYMAIRQRYGDTGAEALMFVSSTGKRLPKRTVHHGYAQVRIHDLRHTFVCRRVQLWHDRGVDIDNAMAALSTYVGHAKVSDTYWYLTGVPDLMAVAGKRFEVFAAGSGGDGHD